jgi:hypothetical protein
VERILGCFEPEQSGVRLMWAQVLTTVIGFWVVMAPAILDYGGNAANHGYVIGPILAAIGWISASEVLRGLRFVNLVPAVALLIVAFGPGYPATALTSSAASAVAVSMLTFVPGRRTRRVGGGWRGVWRAGESTR